MHACLWHVILDWTIQNACFLRYNQCENDRTIKLCLDVKKFSYHHAPWNIKIMSQKVEDDYALSINLESVTRDPIWGTFKFTCSDEEGKTWYTKKYTHAFKTGDSLICEKVAWLSDLNITTDTIVSFQKIVCEMIFGYMKEEEDFIYKIDYDIHDIRTDLFNAYKTSLMTDITLLVENEEIKAHKAVLSARSEVFSEMLKSSDDIVDVPNVKFEVLKKIIEFIYSGFYDYLSYVIAPTFELYDTAKMFKILDLQDILDPVKLNFKSSIVVHKYKNIWIVQNFKKCESFVKCIEYKCKIDFKLCLSYTEEDNFTMIINYSGKNHSDFLVKVSLMDKSENVIEETQKLVFRETADDEGCLTLHFNKFKMLQTGAASREIAILFEYVFLGNWCSSSAFYEDTQSDRILSNFSNDLLSLYENKEFCDVKLVAGNIELQAHKFILAARSPVFKGIFSDAFEEDRTGVFVISNLDPTCLEALLRYIYIGSLKVGDSIEDIGTLPEDIASELYKASDFYMLFNLKEYFSAYWECKANKSNILDLLEMAHVYNDETTKPALRRVLKVKYSNVLKSQEWRYFIEKYPEMK